jgi:LemA protein
MDTGLVIAIVVIGVVVVALVVIGIIVGASHRALVTLHGHVEDAWNEVTAQIGHRAELLPTIVETVQGIATHEKFPNVEAARDESISASDARSASVAEGHMQKALKGVFSVAEGYPQLQTSQSFLRLQSELVATEDRIQTARRRYNGGVRELNAKVRTFPNAGYAKRHGYGEASFFETAEPAAIAEPPRVQF